MLEGYEATVDWPACHFYQELADYYPKAKVLLSIRDPLEWFESMSATTLGVIRKRMQASNAGQPKNLGTELVVNAALVERLMMLNMPSECLTSIRKKSWMLSIRTDC